MIEFAKLRTLVESTVEGVGDTYPELTLSEACYASCADIANELSDVFGEEAAYNESVVVAIMESIESKSNDALSAIDESATSVKENIMKVLDKIINWIKALIAKIRGLVAKKVINGVNINQVQSALAADGGLKDPNKVIYKLDIEMKDRIISATKDSINKLKDVGVMSDDDGYIFKNSSANDAGVGIDITEAQEIVSEAYTSLTKTLRELRSATTKTERGLMMPVDAKSPSNVRDVINNNVKFIDSLTKPLEIALKSVEDARKLAKSVKTTADDNTSNKVIAWANFVANSAAKIWGQSYQIYAYMASIGNVALAKTLGAVESAVKKPVKPDDETTEKKTEED